MSRFDHLIGTELGSGTWTWDSDRALLYAVGVGAGQDDGATELQFTTENTENIPQQVIPSFMSLMAVGGLWMRPLGFEEREWNGIKWGWPKGLVQGDQAITLAKPIPTSGVAELSLVLEGVYDKGSGVLVVADTVVRMAGTSEILGYARAGMFVRGQGGFGGPRAPVDEQAWTRPDRPADIVISQATAPNQSLIYRLSGDRNPHCTDPVRAVADGFDRPIYQGQGTYGFGCRALLQGLCDGDATRFGSMYARFSQPVFPGDVLTTHIWREDGGALFETSANGDRLVLDRGRFSYAA
jgi:acyl dehydratase